MALLAQGTPIPLGNLQLQNSALGGPQTLSSLFPAIGGIRNFIGYILPNALIFASLLLLALVILGGIGLIATAGNAEAQQKNKGIVTNAAIGFVIVFSAYWIIQAIQVVTGVNILK